MNEKSEGQESQPRKAPAYPIATIELGPDRFQVRATTAQSEDRAELAEATPYLEQQQSLTTREIPIVVFERV
jgi:hypothetical protein